MQLPYHIERLFQGFLNVKAMQTAVHVSTDPMHGKLGDEVSIYFDDGRGNGDHVCTVFLGDLMEAVEKYNQRVEGFYEPPSEKVS